MSIRLSKPWIRLDGLDPELLPAQLGVFELADAEGEVFLIGYAGGRELFGLRTAIQAAAENVAGAQVRYELNHGYLSRWEELVMIYRHDHGRLPSANDPATAPKGRLTPIGGPGE